MRSILDGDWKGLDKGGAQDRIEVFGDDLGGAGRNRAVLLVDFGMEVETGSAGLGYYKFGGCGGKIV